MISGCLIDQEDTVRAKYYRKFGKWEVVNLLSPTKTTSQKFLEKFAELEAAGVAEQQLWDRTVSALENEGISPSGADLFTDKDLEFSEDEKSNITSLPSFKDLFKK